MPTPEQLRVENLQTQLTHLRSDGVLTPAEKAALKAQREAIQTDFENDRDRAKANGNVLREREMQDRLIELDNIRKLEESIALAAAPGAPTATPGAAPAPQEKGFAGMLVKLGAFAEKASDRIGTIVDSMSIGGLKAIKTIMEMFGWKNAASFLSDMIAPRELRSKLESGLTKGQKVKKTPEDNTHVNTLKAQHKAFVDAAKDGTPEKAMTYETFLDERIKELDKDASKTEVTLKDLVDTRIAAEKAAEAIKNDKEKQAFLNAGFVEQADKSWVNDKLDLGPDLTDPAHKITSVTFKKNAVDNRWEWTNNSKQAASILATGKMLGNERFDAARAGLTPAQQEASKAMNKLADDLGVKDAPAPAPAGTPKEAPETPEARKRKYAKGLVDAFNNKAGSEIVKIYDADDAQKISDKFIGAMRRDEYDITGVHLELDPDDLEATDTTGSYWTAGFSDKDILDGWAKQIATDPERAVNSFLALNPTALELDTGSAKAIDDIQHILKGIK